MVESRLRLRKRFKQVNNQDLLNSGFWVTNLCMIVATIIGVYLASNEGFRQAMLFDDINTTEANYYLRRSLMLELEDNLTLVKQKVTTLETAQYKRFDPSRDSLELDHYVWNSMQYSPNTMEVPSDLLAGARRYYRTIGVTWQQMAQHQISSQEGLSIVKEANQTVITQVLPGLQTDLATLKQQLVGFGVEVN
ncbi:hypothetical protein [Motilimonas eburnea]|uniref:hypothetical protein n=1 Tax=Motilimonas eburnea TaxID=1737488 RepID=UPI001E3B1D89|nr:hypothetical protein [Motilimonas eburnea]MCE2573691.1 hypothetical protein [Motilimonas eburnea]